MKHIHIFILFIVVAMIQFSIPAKMIFDREDILKTGEIYKFKTQPIDPNDPFRGKYITLNYELDSSKTIDSTWYRDEEILVYLEKDKSGFAQLKTVSKVKLDIKHDFVTAKVSWYNRNDNIVNFDLDFDRYYMEEFKAKPAEDIYRKYNRRQDITNTTFALVAVKNGEAVLKDVLINDKSIKDYIEEVDK